MVFAKGPGVIDAGIEGETVLLNITDGRYFSLNRVGSIAWNLLDGDAPLSSVCEQLRARFEVGEREAWSDLATLVRQLISEKLVVGVGPTAADRSHTS